MWIGQKVLYLVKLVRERQILYVITYMRNLKNKTNEYIKQNRNRLTDIENKLMVTKGERGEGRNKLRVWD